MSWLASIFVALLSGGLGLACAGVTGSLCVEWYRVSKFEGGAGYMVVFIAFLGGIAGFFLGLLVSRLVAAGTSPGFFKGLGFAWGAVLAIALVALLICRLCADIAPKMNGRFLELAVEVRCPKNFTVPVPDEYGASATVYLPGKRGLPPGKLRTDEATVVDGHLTVPGTAPLTTSVREKFLSVRFSKDLDLIFPLRLPGHPGGRDCEWSGWVESGWDAGKPEPAKDQKFAARWRVLKVEPPPPPPDLMMIAAQKYAALTPASPLEEWLPFLFEDPNAERTAAVVRVIGERQADLAKLIRSDNDLLRERALAAAMYLEKPAPELVEAVLAEGRDIAQGIRRFNAMKDDAPDFMDVQSRLRSRFNDWRQAWWVMHKRAGLDGRPPLREIYDLALVRMRGTLMNEIEANARVVLDALEKPPAEKTP